MECAQVWLRRLFTGPDGRDLVGMDARRRLFAGGLRQMVRLRDNRCRTPWCDAPTRASDHVQEHAHGGATAFGNGAGLCVRCNLVKNEPGWHAEVAQDGSGGAHVTRTTTPTGHTYDAVAPPILGWGWSPPEAFEDPLDAELAALVRRMQSVDDAWIDGIGDIDVVRTVSGDATAGLPSAARSHH